jgi:hypothetical protein
MHSHATVMEKNIRRQKSGRLIIPKHTLKARVFTLCGDPLSCYTMSINHNNCICLGSIDNIELM